MLRLKAALTEGTAPDKITLPDAGCEIVFGRGSKEAPVDVALNLRSVISRRHLKIVGVKTEGGGGVLVGYRVEDLKSVNGVFVNGVKIDGHVLKHGDIVQIGGMAGLNVGDVLPDLADVSIKYEYVSSSSSSAPNNRKRSRIGAMDSMQHLKKGSSASSSHSANGDQSSALLKQNALYQEQLMKQQLSMRTQEVEELKQKLIHKEQLLVDSQTALATLDQTMKALELQLQLQFQQQAVPVPLTGAGIDISVVRSAAACPICSLTLVEPVVMRCGHGFCRACLCAHLAKRPLLCLCPCCNDAPPKTSSVTPYTQHFVHSTHLDTLVELLFDASSRTERVMFEKRERNNRAILLSLGLDPDARENAGVNQIDESQHSKKKKPPHKDDSEDGGLQPCDFCGGKHEPGRCPHDDADDDGDNSQDC